MLTRKDIKAKILNVRLKHHTDIGKYGYAGIVTEHILLKSGPKRQRVVSHDIGPDGPWAEKVYTPPVARAAVDGMYQKVSDGSISGWQWTAAATATAL